MIQRQGLRLETFDIVGDLAEARAQILRMGDLVGGRPRADALLAALDAALARLRLRWQRLPTLVLRCCRLAMRQIRLTAP